MTQCVVIRRRSPLPHGNQVYPLFAQLPSSSQRRPGSAYPVPRRPKGGSRPSPLAQAPLALTASGEALLRREPGRRFWCRLIVALLLLIPLAAGAAPPAATPLTAQDTAQLQRIAG